MNAKLVGLVLLAGCVADAGATKQVRCLDVTEDVTASLALMRDGIKAINARDYDAAIRHLQRAVETERRNHVAWFQLGNAYAARYAYADAAKAFEQATENEDDEALYWLKLGLARYELGLADGLDNLPTVKQALTQALALNPGLYRAHHTLGLMAWSAQTPTEAAEAFRLAIVAAPHVPASYVALGELYLEWEYTPEAVQVLEIGDARVDGADRATVRLALGRALRDAGDDVRAIEVLSRALEDQPDLHDARFERGMAYFAAEDYAKAKQDLQEFQKRALDSAITRAIAHTTLAAIRAQEVR